MRIAGTSGVFGNLVMAVGALLLTIERAAARRPVAAAGWAAILMAIFVFEVVDCLVGFVLSSTAADPGGAASFAAFRTVFAVYFLVGTVLFGAGALLALSYRPTNTAWAGPVTWLGRINGAVAVTTGLATFAGFPFSLLAGASVGIGALIFVFVGLAETRDRVDAHP